MDKVSTPESWGDKNKKLIIETLKTEGPMSRAELSRRTGMSFPAISSNIKYLLENKYVYESGMGNNSMGRKSMLISFNANKGFVIGIDLGRSRVSLVLGNLLGEAVFKVSKEVDIHHGKFNIIEQLDSLIKNVLFKNEVEESQLLSIGIGIPGVIDSDTGKIILAPFAEKWGEYNLVQGLQSLYSCPIVFENSVNLGALGEKWKGVGVDYSNILYVNYSIGIGSALIINNELFSGNNGIAGEIAYSIPSPAYKRKSFGEIGSLEALISGKSFDTRVKKMDIGFNSLKELFESSDDKYDELRDEIVKEIKEFFFVILLASITIINPAAVILSGGIGINIGKILKDEWEEDLKAHVRFPPKLLISEKGSLANVNGAVRFALSNIEEVLSASKSF